MSHVNVKAETKIPSIPTITTATQATAINALKQIVETREGLRGNLMDKAVTLRDLFDIGMIEVHDHNGEVFFKQLTSVQTIMPHIENLGSLDASAALATHILAADPHTGYQLEAQKGVAGGYAALDGTGTVPDAQLPAGIARDTEVSTAISDHEAAADPHTQYSLVDGTRAFTGPVGGVDPVAATDLVTRQYLEMAITPISYVPSSLTVDAGTVDAGDVVSLQGLSDGDTLDISEVGATPGFDFTADFTGITELPQHVQIHIHYDGTVGHVVELQMWDWNTSTFDTLTTIPRTTALTFIEMPISVPTDYVNGSGEARVRVVHTSGGNAADNIFTDYIALVKLGFGAVSDHSVLAGLDDDDHLIYALANASAGWAVTPGYTELKSFDPTTCTFGELARVVGTLVDALITARSINA